MTTNEAEKMYNECSERDRFFLEAVLRMLVAIYCTTKKYEKEKQEK